MRFSWQFKPKHMGGRLESGVSSENAKMQEIRRDLNLGGQNPFDPLGAGFFTDAFA